MRFLAHGFLQYAIDPLTIISMNGKILQGWHVSSWYSVIEPLRLCDPHNVGALCALESLDVASPQAKWYGSSRRINHTKGQNVRQKISIARV